MFEQAAEKPLSASEPHLTPRNFRMGGSPASSAAASGSGTLPLAW